MKSENEYIYRHVPRKSETNTVDEYILITPIYQKRENNIATPGGVSITKHSEVERARAAATTAISSSSNEPNVPSTFHAFFLAVSLLFLLPIQNQIFPENI